MVVFMLIDFSRGICGRVLAHDENVSSFIHA